jgi:CheY-like chemotaxis protein/nitrogen-specific signal transduction histidine kinase
MSTDPIEVLLLEDDAGDARLFQATLENAAPGQFKLTVAPRLSEALDLLQSRAFQIVLTDLNLPDSSGIDTFRRIRTQAASIPVLIWSGLADEAMAIAAVQSGAQDYLIKGESPGTQVVRALRHALERDKQSFEEAGRVRTDFFAQLSHDIRTPMVGILGMTAMVLDTELTEEQRSYMHEVQTSAERLLNVITDIGDFSAIDSGLMGLETIDFDLEDVVAAAVKPQSLRAYEKGVELVCHIMSDVPAALVGDPARLRQILASLVGSALKFTERGEVVLHVEMDRGQVDKVQLDRQTDEEAWLRFAIQDTSGDMAADRRQAVAEALSGNAAVQTAPNVRADLSLSIAAQLIARMGGRLCLESVVGEGNILYFTIGFGAPAEHAGGAESLIPGSLKDLRVLIVDDSATQRRVLKELFSHWNMSPATVSSGADALASMKAANDRHEPFGLALIDADMPGTNGFDVAREIARSPQLAQATLMMIASGNLRAEEAGCRELGVSGWVTKPIQQSELLTAVTMAIRLSLEFKGHPPPLARTIRRPAARGLHILIVEDNSVNQKVAAHVLQKRGHTVEIVASAENALIAVSRRTFDLILMDVQMPVMDGFQTTARIRRDESGTDRHVPIMAMTAHAMVGDRERCFEAGMDGYVSKPIETDAFFTAIATVLARMESPIRRQWDDDWRLVLSGNSSVNVAP